jgi:hypothetical protein
MPHRRARLFAIAAVVAAFTLGVPLGIALASHQFSDVPTSSPYHGDIDALFDSGVTTGCGGGKYCPKEGVTREQMAAFLNRLGALGPGKTPVVNADKVDGLEAAAFERSTTVITGIVPFSTTDSRILLDSRTGADVRTPTPGTGSIRIVNTSTSHRMLIAGTSTWGASIGPQPEVANIGPGEVAAFNTDTLPSTYLDLMITLAADTAGATRVSRLTCSIADVGGGPPAWASCILVG